MTSLTLKEVKSGKTEIRFFRSVDKLKSFLQKIIPTKGRAKFIQEKDERKEIVGISYDQDDESIVVLRKFGLIPMEEDYDFKR